MYSVIETEQFANWLAGLKTARPAPDCKRDCARPLSATWATTRRWAAGCGEMREAFGPGWRLYYTLQGSTLIVMLGGGAKATQSRDIERAQAMALEWHHEQDQDPPV